MKQITIYVCDKCGEEFRKRSFCQRHEAECKVQNCNICKHAYWVYGCEFNCALLNNGKECKFEVREVADMKIWLEKAPYGTANQGKYLICCDKTKFSYERKTIIGRLYKATLTDEELEEVKRKIEEALK